MINGGADFDTLEVSGTGNNDTLNIIVSGGVLTRFDNAAVNNIQNVEGVNADLGGNTAAGDTLTYNGTTAAIAAISAPARHRASPRSPASRTCRAAAATTR